MGRNAAGNPYVTANNAVVACYLVGTRILQGNGFSVKNLDGGHKTNAVAMDERRKQRA